MVEIKELYNNIEFMNILKLSIFLSCLFLFIILFFTEGKAVDFSIQFLVVMIIAMFFIIKLYKKVRKNLINIFSKDNAVQILRYEEKINKKLYNLLMILLTLAFLSRFFLMKYDNLDYYIFSMVFLGLLLLIFYVIHIFKLTKNIINFSELNLFVSIIIYVLYSIFITISVIILAWIFHLFYFFFLALAVWS